MRHFVYTLYVVAKTNVHGTNKSGSVAIFMPLSLAHFIEKFWSTAPRTVEIQNSLFCRSRWWLLHCNCEFFSFVPFSHFFSFFIAYKRTSIQQKKSEIQPASLSSGDTSSSLLWKWFLDWNCCFLQTCLAPDFSSLVSVSPHLEWQAPAVCQCWVTAAGGIYVGKPSTIKRCVSKVCFFKLHFYVERVYNYQFII